MPCMEHAGYDDLLLVLVPNPVFDTFTELQQLAASLDEVQTVQSPVQSPVPPLPSDPQIVLMKRVIFWSHHLVAPSKRKQFAAWCPELHVWGLVKLGYPGFLCFEGEHGDVENMIQRVKRMQWHALSMRVEVDWSYAHIDTDSHNICTQALQHCLLKQDGKARTACEEINDMGAFIARCV
ncbi:hypothetical protein MVES_001939 [Malassezia vespertilionis]|uniref:Small nuclear ribonucleoprotein Prp3 C-terminal domain-containing protein n=1 Tax=Malassezia vespertilionis TaxID=2020962 RepID=A0A2N1JBU9_9BASI|nr:hypothetical protein MVES_001939 [Malassezia vespertilionis]